MPPQRPQPPWVLRSIQSPPVPASHPPVVLDVQRVVEHMKADFQVELGGLRSEVALLNSKLDDLRKLLAQQAEEIRLLFSNPPSLPAKQVASPAKDPSVREEPVFFPSDLLTKNEGSVAVKTASDENANTLDAATQMLRKVKRERKP